MKKSLIMIAALAIAISPSLVSAKEVINVEKEEILAETTKYYKTITKYDNLSINAYSSNTVNHSNSYSEEISKEEYDAAEESTISTQESASVETNYKKMTTTIYQENGNYKLKNELNWKTMPSVRSFDIIGIGTNQSVKVAGGIMFNQYYCVSGGSCTTSYSHTPKIGSYGAGATFQLMTGGLSTLRITMYYTLSKNTTATITGLDAYGDYSHATSSISHSDAQNYSVNLGGINLNSSISGKYDSIQSAHAYKSIYW